MKFQVDTVDRTCGILCLFTDKAFMASLGCTRYQPQPRCRPLWERCIWTLLWSLTTGFLRVWCGWRSGFLWWSIISRICPICTCLTLAALNTRSPFHGFCITTHTLMSRRHGSGKLHTLHYIALALHCITLHYTLQTYKHTNKHTNIHKKHTYITLHCIALHCIALHYITLHYTLQTYKHTNKHT